MSGESPWLWIFTGALASGLGGFLMILGGLEDTPVGFWIAGIVMLVIGGLLVQVAIIAAGVAMGLARHETLRARRR